MTEHEWVIDDVLAGDDEQTIQAQIDDHLDELTAYETRLDELTATDIKSFLETYEALLDDLSKISSYYSLRFAEDTSNTDVLAKQKQISQRRATISNKLLFFFDWFKNLDDDEAQAYIDADELSTYAYYLSKLRDQAQHTLSQDVEEALTIKDIAINGLSDLYDTITNDFSYEFQGDELTYDELKTYVQSTDAEERRQAYTTMLETFEEHSTVLTELYTMIANDWRNEATQLRGYDDSLAVRSTGQDISKEAVETLINVVRDNKELFHDYFQTKQNILQDLGEDVEMNRYHIYAPLKTSKATYTFDEAKNLIFTTFKSFDERFYNAAKQIFDADHIHSHPKKNKRSGAFCMEAPTGIPPYILTNYDGNLNDVKTLAHELGHGIHDVFIDKQTKLNRHPVLPMAETASVFAEMLLQDNLQDDVETPKDEIAILGDFLDDQFGTILRQIYFTEFERQAHKALADGASQEDLNTIYHDLLNEQFGDIPVPEAFKREWNSIPHIHHSPFYCYAYAWGNLLVLSLYDAYQEQGDAFIEDYIDVLQAGKSESPADLLARFGFDPTNESFWQRGFDIIQDRYESLKQAADRLE